MESRRKRKIKVALQFHREVMGDDVHPACEIKPVRAEAVDAGVEMELVAAPGLRQPDQPGDQLLPVALRAELFAGDEVVDVHEISPREAFGEAITGGGFDGFPIGEEGQMIAGLALSLDLRDKGVFLQVRTQLNHDGKAAADLRLSFGDGDRGHGRKLAKGTLRINAGRSGARRLEIHRAFGKIERDEIPREKGKADRYVVGILF
jgi:hypothetical protein